MSAQEGNSSETSSMIGLQNIQLNRNNVHPEQWTLPGEWNMEQRELYGSWKMDIQNQIKFIENQLGYSLQRNPNPEVGQLHDTRDPFWEAEKRFKLKQDKGNMQRGLQARK